ncbi:MAG: imidazole glycerol phosphate synthase cyclase subunit [Gemmatimonadetes bacterium]|nr:imidazole glycerol phosphate synthase cyclase subunit [Gemmatimonadota bacterium]
MLVSRIIPCLLVKDRGLVKSVRFQDHRYVGDPINAVKIFNEKEVDELVILDIDASAEQREPDYQMIANVAQECRMPLCYGGGVRTAEQVQRIIKLGVEKVAVGLAALEVPALVSDAARIVGNQSVVVILDVRKVGGKYEVFTRRGTEGSGKTPVELGKHFESAGAGEIIVNAIDQDGVMEGYDLQLVEEMYEAIHVPLTILGGAGSLEHIRLLLFRFGQLGASAGSLFVYRGKFKAVLINYPTAAEKRSLISQS